MVIHRLEKDKESLKEPSQPPQKEKEIPYN